MGKEKKSVGDINKELFEKHNTIDNTFEMFPVGTKVQVIITHCDFRGFKGCETGTVERNTGKYLGIRVELDKEYAEEHGIKSWGFDPKHLIVL